MTAVPAETHDERCCMNGVAPGAGPHPDCPGVHAEAPTAALHRALADPGSVLPRLSGEWGLEPLPEWQARAVLEAAAPAIRAQVLAEVCQLLREHNAWHTALLIDRELKP